MGKLWLSIFLVLWAPSGRATVMISPDCKLLTAQIAPREACVQTRLSDLLRDMTAVINIELRRLRRSGVEGCPRAGKMLNQKLTPVEFHTMVRNQAREEIAQQKADLEKQLSDFEPQFKSLLGEMRSLGIGIPKGLPTTEATLVRTYFNLCGELVPRVAPLIAEPTLQAIQRIVSRAGMDRKRADEILAAAAVTDVFKTTDPNEKQLFELVRASASRKLGIELKVSGVGYVDSSQLLTNPEFRALARSIPESRQWLERNASLMAAVEAADRLLTRKARVDFDLALLPAEELRRLADADKLSAAWSGAYSQRSQGLGLLVMTNREPQGCVLQGLTWVMASVPNECDLAFTLPVEYDNAREERQELRRVLRAMGYACYFPRLPEVANDQILECCGGAVGTK